MSLYFNRFPVNPESGSLSNNMGRVTCIISYSLPMSNTWNVTQPHLGSCCWWNTSKSSPTHTYTILGHSYYCTRRQEASQISDLYLFWLITLYYWPFSSSNGLWWKWHPQRRRQPEISSLYPNSYYGTEFPQGSSIGQVHEGKSTGIRQLSKDWGPLLLLRVCLARCSTHDLKEWTLYAWISSCKFLNLLLRHVAFIWWVVVIFHYIFI